jgi:glycogen debranching enzyme
MTRQQEAAPSGTPARPDGSERQYGPKKSRSARVRSIAGAVTLKDSDTSFLCDRDGQVPLGGKHGFGLYYHDCRFLNGYELCFEDRRPGTLMADGGEDFKADLVLTNPELRMPDGSVLQTEDVAVHWERLLDGDGVALHDRITFRNCTPRDVEFPVTLRFRAGFEDVFAVRGQPARVRGKGYLPAWDGGTLTFRYDGSDGVTRRLSITCDPAPEDTDGTGARFSLPLRAQESKTLLVTLAAAESSASDGVGGRPAGDFAALLSARRRAFDGWLAGQTQVHSSDAQLDRLVSRSLRDLRMLRSELDGLHYFAAGVPWYVALFGRDSLIASLETLAYEPQVAAQTLRLLARYQGTRDDESRDEQPGKVMHELRVGEWAHTGKIPQTPYYGSIDATPLFLVLLARHEAWTGDLGLFLELREAVERALAWMAGGGDPAQEGYLAYQKRSKAKQALSNQGWKDSGDSIVNTDGSLAQPPIALAEVQGYVYLAKTGLGDLYERAGDGVRAGQLRREAEDLRQRFERDFWLEDKGIYALALQEGKEPAAVVASNAGQVLWSGIAAPDRAGRTARRLLAEDMFSGWGVRTLSARERRYNPIGYHLGTVWPHDNALILAGLRRYGRDDEAARVFTGIAEAAGHFAFGRLPEVFAGFDRERFRVPVHYPIACHPQAWAAGSVPYMLESLLGLRPEAFKRRLRVVRPLLPGTLRDLELHNLRVGAARVDLRFERTPGGRTGVRVLRTEGELDVVVQGE